MRSVKRATALALVVLLLIAPPAPSATARSDETGFSCSYGTVRSLLEAFPAFFHFQPPQFEYPDCQIRVWVDGEEATFSETDWFLAGLVEFVQYVDLGMTRSAAIEMAEQIEYTILLFEILPGDVVGEPVELEVVTGAAWKDFVSPIFGHVVYRPAGVILQLPPGDYLVHYEDNFHELFGGERFTADSTVHITAAG